MLSPSDSFLAVDADGVIRPPIGTSAFGSTVFAPFRPSPMFLANTMHSLDLGTADPNRHIRLPHGMSFTRAANAQLQLALSNAFARRLRRVLGYVAEIQLSSTGRGATPFPYRNSWISTVFGFPLLIFYRI